MDFLYRNIHMEQKKWEASTQMTIEEDVNVPDAKGDCMAILLKDAAVHVDETRVGREQVVVKGNLNYQILYASGNKLEQLCGSLPFEEVMNVTGAVPGDLAVTKGVIEDFKVSMINTRKLAIQSVVMLHTAMNQLAEEEWSDDVVNCGSDVQKRCETKEVMQLVQKKSDVFRIKEELELPGGYPAVQNIVWESVSLGNVETRPMDGKISLKGECNCYVIYVAQGASQAVKMISKKVPFHGLVECSGCESDMTVSVMPTLTNYTLEVKPDMDGEDRVLFLDAPLDLQIRIYRDDRVDLLQDIYSTNQEIVSETKTIHVPVLYLAGEGKCKLKQSHRFNEGTPRAVQILHTCGRVFPDGESWEDGRLHMMGSVLFQMLYMTGEEEMPYAVTECMVPYTLEMDSNVTGTSDKPMIIVEPRMEQMEAGLVDSEEIEVKGIVTFTVIVLGSQEDVCVGSAEAKPIDTAKYASLPSMVVCFAEQETPLWDYGKRYYMPVEEMKRLNNRNEDTLKAGESMLLVKGC